MTIVASAGERVQGAETGNTICELARDIRIYDQIQITDFHNFAEGEMPWLQGDPLDPRCTRATDNGWQIFVEGEWRP